MKREANEIEKEYWMNRKKKIKALMSFYGLTKKEAEEWLEDGSITTKALENRRIKTSEAEETAFRVRAGG